MNSLIPPQLHPAEQKKIFGGENGKWMWVALPNDHISVSGLATFVKINT